VQIGDPITQKMMFDFLLEARERGLYSAITGIVGVNRDPFGTGRGADLLVNVWGYCFASPFHDGPLPPGLLHPRRIRAGVHSGVIDGGNQSGIPYGRGWELFDHRYLGKPLVFCGTVGALPTEIAGTPGEDKAARPGDVIVMVGGRIGADGIHGATFSSAASTRARRPRRCRSAIRSPRR
jgi:phosphoribosylformylglycinamidine synthase